MPFKTGKEGVSINSFFPRTNFSHDLAVQWDTFNASGKLFINVFLGKGFQEGVTFMNCGTAWLIVVMSIKVSGKPR